MLDSNGCPVCKNLCCCSEKNPNCQKKHHCYKKCEVYKSKSNMNSMREGARNSKRSKSANESVRPLFVSPHLIPNTPTRTETSLLVKPPCPEQVDRQSQHLLPLSTVLRNLHRLPPLPTASKALLSSIKKSQTSGNANVLDFLLRKQHKDEEKSQFSQCSHDSKSWGSGLSNCDQSSQPFSQSVFENTPVIKLSSPISRTETKAYSSINTLAEALEILQPQGEQT